MAQEATLNVNIVDQGTSGPMPPSGGGPGVGAWQPPKWFSDLLAKGGPGQNEVKDYGGKGNESTIGKDSGSKKTGIATIDYAVAGFAFGPIGAAAGAAVGALKDFEKYLKNTAVEISRFDTRAVMNKILGPFGELSEAVSGTARRLSQYSAELSAQQAQFEVRRMMRDIDRAQNFGGDLAAHEEERFQLEQRIANIMDRTFPIIVRTLTNILEGVNQSVDIADKVLAGLENIAVSFVEAIPFLGDDSPLRDVAGFIHEIREELRRLRVVAETSTEGGLFVDELFAAHVPLDVRRAEEGVQNMLQMMRRNFIRGAMPAAPVFPNLNL